MITPAEFVDIVDRALRPVLSAKGFEMVATGNFTVEFRSRSTSLVVSYEPRSASSRRTTSSSSQGSSST
jgi:hypothetical protein